MTMRPTRTAAEATAAQLDPRRWLALGVVLIAVFMQLMDISIVNVAIPSIQRDLDASYSQVQWVLAGYQLAFAVVLITGGRLGDIYVRDGLEIRAGDGAGRSGVGRLGAVRVPHPSDPAWAGGAGAGPAACGPEGQGTGEGRREAAHRFHPRAGGGSGSEPAGAGG